jgi:hypothetical protein
MTELFGVTTETSTTPLLSQEIKTEIDHKDAASWSGTITISGKLGVWFKKKNPKTSIQ